MRLAVVGQRDRALDLVLELAHVAGEGIGAQAAQRLGRDAGDRAPGALAERAQEVVREDAGCPRPARAAAAGGSGRR